MCSYFVFLYYHPLSPWLLLPRYCKTPDASGDCLSGFCKRFYEVGAECDRCTDCERGNCKANLNCVLQPTDNKYYCTAPRVTTAPTQNPTTFPTPPTKRPTFVASTKTPSENPTKSPSAVASTKSPSAVASTKVPTKSPSSSSSVLLRG